MVLHGLICVLGHEFSVVNHVQVPIYTRIQGQSLLLVSILHEVVFYNQGT